LRATRAALLSRFDPLVWDCARANALFNFEYAIECCRPAAKRRYSYFALPILRRGRLIGRLDAKVHRAEGLFEVKALYLEPDVAITEGLLKAVAKTTLASAQWHGTREVKVVRAQPSKLRGLLNNGARQYAGLLPLIPPSQIERKGQTCRRLRRAGGRLWRGRRRTRFSVQCLTQLRCQRITTRAQLWADVRVLRVAQQAGTHGFKP
jgi:hypothetical protein